MQRAWSAEEWRKRQVFGASRPGAGRQLHSSSEGAPKSLRSIAPFVLWLLLLVWPTPEIGSFVATLAPTVASATIQGAESWTAQALQRIPDGLAALTSANQEHVYWQIGLSAGDEDRNATGMRATIVTTLPQRVSPDTTNYFWVGSYLSDGSFIQAGYYVPAHDTHEAGWFYCAFHTDAKEGPCEYGPLGAVGVNGAIHTYALASSAGPTAGAAVWTVTMDDSVLGEFSWPVGDSGVNTPVIYAESSGFTAHAATSELGPVDFKGNIEIRTLGSAAYAPAAHLFAIFNAPNVCPPYGISSDGDGGVLLGSGLSCPDQGSQFK